MNRLTCKTKHNIRNLIVSASRTDEFLKNRPSLDCHLYFRCSFGDEISGDVFVPGTGIVSRS